MLNLLVHRVTRRLMKNYGLFFLNLEQWLIYVFYRVNREGEAFYIAYILIMKLCCLHDDTEWKDRNVF
jgi:hypothetical protein